MVVGAKLNSKIPFIVGLTRQILELKIKEIKVTTARDFSTPVILHSLAQIIKQYLKIWGHPATPFIYFTLIEHTYNILLY
jgi:hypothetical protein